MTSTSLDIQIDLAGSSRSEGGALTVRGARVGSLVGLVAMAVVAVVVAVSLLVASSAQAATSFTRVGAFVEQGVDGELRHSERIAVQQSTGLIFRTELRVAPVSDRVGVYRPNDTAADELTSFGSDELIDPFGIAIDQSTGSVYVADAGNNRIVRYVSDAGDPPTYTLDATFTSPVLGSGAGQVGSFAAAIAVDPTNGNLLVADPANNRVKRYDSTGAYLSSFDGTGSTAAFTGLQDLAVDSTGDVIVIDSDGTDPADGGSSRIERFSADGTWESTLGPVENAANVAVRPVNDEVVVSGNQDAVNDGQPTYPTLFVFDASSSVEVPLLGAEYTSTQYGTVSGLAVGGGLSGRLYVATDTSRGSYPACCGLASVQVYIPPDAPVIDDASTQASIITPTGARLSTLVDPGRGATTVHFEYGTTSAYGQTTSGVAAGAGDEPKLAGRTIEGLQPSTTYHYRVVADNGVGAAVVGVDHTFTTAAPDPSAVTGAVSDLTMTSATLTGSVDTDGLAGMASFSIVQTDGGYATSTVPVELSAIDGLQAVTARVAGLPAGGTFDLQLAVSTAGGTSFGDVVSFSTAPKPAFITPPPPPPGLGSGYACTAPVLDTYNKKPKPGTAITLTGSGLGTFGTVLIGPKAATVTDHTDSAVTVIVPAEATATLGVSINCGQTSNTIGLAIYQAPDNAFAIAKATVRGSSATLTIKVPGAGKLTATSSKTRTIVRRASTKGNVKLQLRLTPAATKALRKAKRLTITARVVYTPTGGTPRTVTRTITFKPKASR